jgi:transcriptional regulator with GAF, ATPase, and Fis domain
VAEDPTVYGGAFARLAPLLERIAGASINVLLLGETGVGKEVVAEWLHRLSPRSARPLLKLNCAALSEPLLESELFGHERGAFTGAHQAKPGLLESARGGTVFLDEVGELSAATQSKLLRVLEERKARRVGALRLVPIDVRFVAATNRDLEADARNGQFRRDLYFRLSGISLVIPPLRERVGEIEALARAFVAATCRESHRGREPSLSPAAIAALTAYAWPGNVRELRNVIERAVLLSVGDTIELEHLPQEQLRGALVLPWHAGPGVPASAPASIPAATGPAGGERERIVKALADCAGNQTRAAKLLGMSRRTLTARLGALALPRPRKRR